MKSLGTARFFFIAAAATAGIFMALSTPRAESEFTEEVKKQREKQLRDVDTVRQEIDSLRKKIAEKKWTFAIGETEASRYSLKLISGYKEIKEDKKSYAISNGKVVVKPDNADKKDEIPKGGLLADPDSASFNLRDKGLLTPIRSQKGCGSCWAFTAIGTYESAYLVRNGVSLDLSEQFIVNCARSGSCSGGRCPAICAASSCTPHTLSGSALAQPLAFYKNPGRTTICFRRGHQWEPVGG
ncbi:MAG TPA: C1 family peptidase [Elusimicrobiales bacterium]|nr:C1 family peptidase [Elusimicrobiales bacterium]